MSSVRKTSVSGLNATPKRTSDTPVRGGTEDHSSLTDNLLKLPTNSRRSGSNNSEGLISTRRPKASDFFT
jgi:hypothetical protein